MSLLGVKSPATHRLRVGAVVALLALGLSGCAPADTAPGAASNPASPAPAELSGTLNVFAAASLKQTFTELATQYREGQPQGQGVPEL